MPRSLALGLCGALVFLVAACGGGSGSNANSGSQPDVTMKLGHDSPLDFPYQYAAEAFKTEVEKNTNGHVKVQIYPNAQLGDEGTMVNDLKVGAVDGVYTSTAPLTQSVPQLDIVSLPFIFKDVDQALRVMNGPIGRSLSSKIDAATGAQIVGWASVGERDMWNSKHPIQSVADMQGLKMRVQQSQIQEDTYAALGAQATPIPFSELYTALQTHVVDGADNGPLDIESSKFYQVTKYVTFTRHFILLTPMLISDKFLAKLSSSEKTAVLSAAKDTIGVVTNIAKEQNSSDVDQLKSQGLQFIELSDSARAEFVSKVQTVYTKNADRVGGMTLINQVLNTP